MTREAASQWDAIPQSWLGVTTMEASEMVGLRNIYHHDFMWRISSPVKLLLSSHLPLMHQIYNSRLTLAKFKLQSVSFVTSIISLIFYFRSGIVDDWSSFSIGCDVKFFSRISSVMALAMVRFLFHNFLRGIFASSHTTLIFTFPSHVLSQ